MSLNTTPGDAAADSYASVSDADAYFSARGITTWSGTDAAKENALRRSTQYLDNAYRDRWVGVRTNQLQSLAWPRGDGYGVGFIYPLLDTDGFRMDPTVVPVQIQRATIEAALLYITGSELQPNLTRGNAIKSISKGVGPLSKSIVYRDDAPAIDRYTAIEGLLRGLVTSTPGATSGTVRIVRG